ncbi:MAG: FKBP-type peptidyl-prolyl cis-trans isomerase [Bacteroidales bacterium]|nr:FKBP-type peptidyl-prolyl cis-trans isomerase [Bacteroidales bacterium]MDE6872332.1 FKBP-type peptidyl-prolyl cis-trans isomerase [Bacteroidales bacterium]
MKKILSAVTAAAIMLGLAGCAKEKSESTNEASQRYFEAWMHVHHPEAEKTGLGIYILEDTEGTGEAEGIEGAEAGLDFTDASYIYVTYTARDLNGNVSSTNDKKIAQQLGSYDKSYYYGPEIWSTSYMSLPAGVREMLKGMKTRGKRTAVIPAWLMDTKEYETEQEYLDNVTDKSSAIYTIEVADTTNDIYRKQIEKIEKLEYEYTDSLGRRQVWKVSAKDTIYTGFYYLKIQTGVEVEVEDEDAGSEMALKALEDNSTVHINYTGSLLNGQVFDTTDEKTAKDNNIYSSSKTYSKVSATWSSDSTAVQLNSNTVIQGFSSTICRMKYYGAKGIGVFYSALGYGASGSGSIIPSYAPLIFEVNIEVEEE